MPRSYPLSLNLRRRRCLVVGGGAVAARKVRGLLAAGAVVRVVAPRIAPSISAGSGVECLRRPYRKSDALGCALVFAATDDPAVNARVAADARAAGVWCCRVDEPTDGDLTVPAVFRRGRITVAVDTGGASPALAARLAERLKSLIGPEYSQLAAALAALRPRLLRRVADAGRRAALLRSLCDRGLRAIERDRPRAGAGSVGARIAAALDGRVEVEPRRGRRRGGPARARRRASAERIS